MTTRIGLGALGVIVGVYGAWLMLSRQETTQIVDAAVWLGGGVIVHDFVLTAVVMLLGAVALRFVPSAARAPAVVGLVVLGSVTLAAIPVLTGLGASDERGLQERPYLVGWLILAAVILVAVAVATVVRSRRTS
ncbi:MAG: hypothetical protein WKF79_06590 [Nocardioides sp.]